MPEEALPQLTPLEYYDYTEGELANARGRLAEQFLQDGQVDQPTMFHYVASTLTRDIAGIRAHPEMYNQNQVPDVIAGYQAILRDCRAQAMTEGVITVLDQSMNQVRDSIERPPRTDKEGEEAPQVEGFNRTADFDATHADLLPSELAGLNYCFYNYAQHAA